MEKKSINPALSKAYEKATEDGPIEDTLEFTEEQIKKLIKAADQVILDAADTARNIPAAAVDAAKTVVNAGVGGAKAAGRGWLNAVKSLGNLIPDFGGMPAGSLMGPAPKKKMSAEQAKAIRDSRADNVKPKRPLPTKPRPVRDAGGRPKPPTLPPSL